MFYTKCSCCVKAFKKWYAYNIWNTYVKFTVKLLKLFFSTQKKLQSKYLWGQIINFERKYLTLLYTDVSTWMNQIVNNVLAPTHSVKVRRGHIIYLWWHNITKILLGMPLEVIVVWFPKQVTIHKFFFKSWTLNITDVKKRKWLDFLDFRLKNF